MERKAFPERGLDADVVLDEMENRRDSDTDWRNGRTWNLVYHPDDDIKDFRERAHEKYASENALGPSAFPSLRRFENEVVAMTADLLGGDNKTVGNITSGGTESILLAVKTARDWAQENLDIGHPEIIAPETVHPAFAKAAHYFGMDLTTVSTTSDWRADPEAMVNAITDETALMVGSAPSYPHGVIDPIEEIAAAANERGLLCHVDACIGGFVLPFLPDIGYSIPDFDLSLPGVSSLSVDPHKYGYTAKGASVILYRDDLLRQEQYFAYDGWPGGVYVAPNMTGTRPGGPIASAWAVLNHIGKEGYRDYTQTVMETTEQLQQGIEAIDMLKVVSDPDMCIFAFESTSDEVNIYSVHEELTKRDWTLSRQQRPPNIHLSVMPSHARIVDEFLTDLIDSTNAARNKQPEHETALYGGGGALSPNTDLESAAIEMLNQVYHLK